MADGNRHIDVCIVCAKADEAQAVVKEFSSRCRVSYKQDFIESDNNYKYEYDYMEIKNEKKEALTVLVTCLAYQGPVQTASFVTFLLNTFHPRFAAMTGYCAGDKTELNLGDLVVAEAAYHYEEGKVKEVEDGQKLHVPLIRPKEPAINIIQYVNRFNTWKKPVGNITPPEIENALADSNQVKCLVGYMASGMAVRRDNLFEELRSHNHKTVALEMEAAAFYEAVSSFSDIYSLVVKGVCDYADMNKHDKYHEYAARVSATYLLYFIRRYVTEATMPRRDNHQNPQDTLLGGRGIPTSVVFEQFPELRAICSDITERRLSTVREKYSEGLYLQREHVHRAFMRFLEDPTKRGFVLVGGSGVGKSNFLLAARKELQSQESVCMLMYDAASLEHPLVETIEEDFHQQRRAWTTQRLWEKIENIDGIDKRLVLLCMDALNEHEQPRPLLRQLNELIQRPWPWLKVVIVSRPEAWQSIRYGVKLAEALYYRGEGATLGAILESFNYSERLEPFSRQELPLVYAKYKQVNEVQTAYEDLSGRLRDIISDPFNLWLVTKTYKTIPEHLKTTTLITEYIYALTKDPQSKRLQGGDPDWLENQLIPLMVRKVVRKEPYANVITSDELNDADPPLYKALLARADSSELPQHQSFTNLVDAGILRRKPREIGFAIDFKYERFYDYFVGRRLFHMSEAPQTDRYGYFLDMIGRTTEYPYLWGAIRNALIQEAEKPNIEIVLELCRTPDQHVREMMVSVLTALGADAPQKVESILKELVPAARRATTIKRVRQWQGKATVDADRPAWYAGRIATEVASNLDMPGLLQTAALQEDSTIRTEAVRFAFHLWKRDQPAGFAILEYPL